MPPQVQPPQVQPPQVQRPEEIKLGRHLEWTSTVMLYLLYPLFSMDKTLQSGHRLETAKRFLPT